MQTNTLAKWLFLALIVAVSAVLIIPMKDKLRLGLDLQGGHSFTVELDRDALAETVRERMPDNSSEAEINNRIAVVSANADETAVEIIRNRIDAIGTQEPVITRGGNGRIYVQIPGASDAQREEAERMVKQVAFLDFRLVSSQSASLGQRLMDSGQAPQGYKITTVASRTGGTRQYYIRDDKAPESDVRDLQRFGNPPANNIFMLEKSRVEGFGEPVYLPIFVGRRALLNGANISQSKTDSDQFNRPTVSLRFNMEGSKKFAEVTGQYCPGGSRNRDSMTGRQLAIVLDGVVYSAPTINDRIDSGSAVISGSFTLGEARELRNVLNAGAMPAPLKFLGKRFVSPTLGEDSIRGAKLAIGVGLAGILVFLLWYYRFMGLVAYIAIILNLILLPVCAVLASNVLSIFTSDATMAGGSILKLPVLTLPGIAGILLTLGMAVDANVLIYERTREEQALGRPPYASIMAGYQRAFLAIFDGNLTTVITAVILFVFGTGIIRGFSVTLVAGIIASMYTALVVTKMIFKATVKESASKPMRMMQMIPTDINIPFNKYFKPFATAAVAIIVATLAITIARGIKNPTSVFGVDFTGGATVTFDVANAEAAPISAVREVLEAAGITDAAPQYQKDSDSGSTFLEIKTAKQDTDFAGREVSDIMTSALSSSEELKGATFTVKDVDSIGSQIGSEMKRSAGLAIILSTIAMLIYIALRFEFGFGLGAVAALAHDVLITIGIFACLGFQFDLTIVAAMLTIVGYGVNDTIVLFDRVREELKRDQRTPFPELANRCVNITLSRTILTSVTTLITVVALLIFAKGDIVGFAACMLIGIIVSTFSTIFIATPVMLAWYHNKRPMSVKGE